jgi:hypothetical protein
MVALRRVTASDTTRARHAFDMLALYLPRISSNTTLITLIFPVTALYYPSVMATPTTASVHSLENKENIPLKPKKIPVPKKEKRSTAPPKKAKWSAADDATLIEALKQQARLGNQADNSWKQVVWTAAETALRGSELASGGAPKKSKGCNDHWTLVSSVLSYCYFYFNRLSTRILAVNPMHGCPNPSWPLRLGMG